MDSGIGLCLCFTLRYFSYSSFQILEEDEEDTLLSLRESLQLIELKIYANV